MVVLGLELDDLLQQRFHLLRPAELLGHHRLLVDQVRILGRLLDRLAQQVVGGLPLLVLAQQLGFGQHAGAAVLVAVGGQLPQQLAALVEPALARQQRGAAVGDVQVARRGLDAGQALLGGLEVAAHLGGLRQQQLALQAGFLVGLVQAGRRDRALRQRGRGAAGLVHQLQVALQRGLGRVGMLQVQLQRAQRQPVGRILGRLLRQHAELPRGVAGPLGPRQRAGVGQAQRLLVGLGLQLGGDQRLGLGAARQQLQRHQQRFLALGEVLGGGADVDQRGLVAVGVLGELGQHQQRRETRLRLRGGLAQQRLEGLQHARRFRAALEQRRQRPDQRAAAVGRRQRQQRAQHRRDLGRAVQQREQLDLRAVRLQRSRQCLAPGAGGDGGLVAGARLQRDLDHAAEQFLVIAAAGGVEQHLVSDAGLAALELELADQQLVEHRRVEVGIDDRRRGGGGGRVGRGWRFRGLGLGVGGAAQGEGGWEPPAVAHEGGHEELLNWAGRPDGQAADHSREAARAPRL